MPLEEQRWNAINLKLDNLERESDQRHSENRDRLTRIESSQEHSDESLVDLNHKLFGNGQPGLLHNLEVRLTTLEKAFWRAIGALALLAFIAEMVLALMKK